MQKLIHPNCLDSRRGKAVSSNVSNQTLIYQAWPFLIHGASHFFPFFSPPKKITSYIRQFQGSTVAEGPVEEPLGTHSWRTSGCAGNRACPPERPWLLRGECVSPSAEELRAGPGSATGSGGRAQPQPAPGLSVPGIRARALSSAASRACVYSFILKSKPVPDFPL